MVRPMRMSTYTKTLKSLFARTADGIKLGLDTTRALLRAFGDPQDGLEHVVIVAGTNGKGSTSALLASALTADWPDVGFFSSPHLLRFADRIRIGRDTISDDAVMGMYEEIERVEHVCPQRPTFFECATVMAVLAYARAGVKTAVFEVGLGGRLDATNVLKRDLAVITPIGLDHMKFLGDSVELIAAEKAAIIPERGIVVAAGQVPAARTVIERVAAEKQARLVHAPASERDGDALLLVGQGLTTPIRISPWRLPAYQQQNVATAAAACQELVRLGVLRTSGAVERAVAAFDWPGRYQWIEGEPPLDVVINGGVAGDQATVAALVNAARGLLQAPAGLLLITDLPVPRIG